MITTAATFSSHLAWIHQTPTFCVVRKESEVPRWMEYCENGKFILVFRSYDHMQIRCAFLAESIQKAGPVIKVRLYLSLSLSLSFQTSVWWRMDSHIPQSRSKAASGITQWPLRLLDEPNSIGMIPAFRDADEEKWWIFCWHLCPKGLKCLVYFSSHMHQIILHVYWNDKSLCLPNFQRSMTLVQIEPSTASLP